MPPRLPGLSGLRGQCWRSCFYMTWVVSFSGLQLITGIFARIYAFLRVTVTYILNFVEKSYLVWPRQEGHFAPLSRLWSMSFSQWVSFYNEWLPSITKWVWPYSTSVFALTLSWYLFEWNFHFIGLVHQLTTLTDWHLPNKYSEWMKFPFSLALYTDCPSSPTDIFKWTQWTFSQQVSSTNGCP